MADVPGFHKSLPAHHPRRLLFSADTIEDIGLLRGVSPSQLFPRTRVGPAPCVDEKIERFMRGRVTLRHKSAQVLAVQRRATVGAGKTTRQAGDDSTGN